MKEFIYISKRDTIKEAFEVELKNIFTDNNFFENLPSSRKRTPTREVGVLAFIDRSTKSFYQELV
jgi:hypothetical protein